MRTTTGTCSLLALFLFGSLALTLDFDLPVEPHFRPFESREAAESFLRTAKIVGHKATDVGVTKPWKLTLDDGRYQHKALFKYIDDRRLGVYRMEDGTVEFDFKDSWKFEVAAYELDKLLSLDMVPVTVERTYRNKRGSLQFWIDGVPATDCDRSERPPVSARWQWKLWKVWVFDKLIYNIDRNLGNILVTPDWNLIMIDHSRSFKSIDGVREINQLEYFSRSLMTALANLDAGIVREKLGEWLTASEINALMNRSDILVARYQSLVAEKGIGIVYP